MEKSRYTTVLRAEGLLLQPDCPVHAKKLQCTKDTLTGSLFLQVRYVNRCERTVESLIIRVAVFDGGKEIATIRALPISGLCGKPHQCFGDEKTVVLPRCGEEIRVTVEQVSFSDGFLWRSKASPAPLVIEPPIRICGKAQPCRKDGYWYCSCSMVNPDSRDKCDYCGSPAPAAEPTVCEKPEPPAVPAPQSTPVRPEQSDGTQPSYSAEQMRTILSAIPSSTAPVEAPKKKSSLKGLWVSLIVLVLLAIGAGIYFGFPYPYIDYYQAMQLKSSGKYDAAVTAFEKLGNYRDSEQQISDCLYRKALESYQAGDYKLALEQAAPLSTEEGKQLSLNCLYMLSSLCLTEQSDYLGANNYLEQARGYLPNGAQEPDWFQTVRQQSLYLEAMDAYNRKDYEKAADLFTESGYGNALEWVDLCQYQLATAYYNNAEFEKAVDIFLALGDFEESRAMANASMYGYIKNHLDRSDERTEQYLLTLIDNGYPGAQEIYDELYAWAVELSRDSSGALSDVSALVFTYKVTGGPRDGSTLAITMEYTLPNGKSASVSLATMQKPGDEVLVRWSDILTVKDNTKGTLKLRFLNTATNDVLATLNVVVSG